MLRLSRIRHGERLEGIAAIARSPLPLGRRQFVLGASAAGLGLLACLVAAGEAAL